MKKADMNNSCSNNGSFRFRKVFLVVLFLLIVVFFIFIKFFDFSIFFESADSVDKNLVSVNGSDFSSDSDLINSNSKKPPVSFNLVATGDILCHNTQYFDAYIRSSGLYDFNYVFDDVKKYIEPFDIAISSLETSFAGADKGYSNYPRFNTPDSLAEAIKNTGIDIVSTAGNHCLDYGFSGLSRTIDVLDANGLDHLGTYKTKEDQSKILYKYIGDVKIAFLNYTYGTNGIPIPDGKDFCVNLIDKNLISSQISQAKAEGANLIVACMHWGTEYLTSSNSEQEDLADFLFLEGVDIIIGNHPHVIEPFEKREVTLEDGSVKTCFVAYALGNFTADQNYENTRDSIILNLSLTYDFDDGLLINSVTYTPVYIYENNSVSTHKFKLIDIEDAIEKYESGIDTSIGASLYNTLKKELDNIVSIVGDELV